MSAAKILSIFRDGETVTETVIDREALIGRAEDCVIRLDDRAISRQHVSIKPMGDGVQVERRSEFAPLSVNGVDCTRAVVKEGDVVSIGPYLLRVKAQAPEARAASPAPVAEVLADPLATASVAELPPLGESVAAAAPALATMEEVPTPTPEAPGLTLDAGGLEAPGLDSGQPLVEQPVLDEVIQNQAAVETPSFQDPAVTDEDAKTRIVSPDRVQAQLIFPAGLANVETFDLTGDEVSIGRGKNCDIVLNDKRSSRKHAVIRRDGPRFVIRDLDSANGVFVNDAKVTEQELSGDDRILVGDVEFRFQAQSADYAAREAAGFEAIPDDLPPAVAGPVEAGGITFDSSPPGGELVAADPAAAAGAMPLDLSAAPSLPGSSAPMAGIPGISGIPGTGPASGGKQSLYNKYIRNFSSLPTKQKVLVVVFGILLAFELLEPEDQTKKEPPKKGVTAATGAAGVKTFAQLSPEDKKYVENQHRLAFEYYRQQDFDRALYEAEKIYKFLPPPSYKDTDEIVRLSRDGKRLLEQIKEEERRKEEEARIKAKVEELVIQIREKMEAKDYAAARDLFGEVMALDPENTQIAAWKKQIEDFEEAQRLAEQERQVQGEINRRAQDALLEGNALRKRGRYHAAIEVYGRIADIGSNDPGVTKAAAKGIAICRAQIRAKREPILAEAEMLEKSGDFAQAFKLFERATKIDPPHPAGYAGMQRVRGVLHDRAKVIYAEAVLAESFSDFANSERRFREVLKVAPTDDLYFERAKRKLNSYDRMRGPAGLGGGDEGTGGP